MNRPNLHRILRQCLRTEQLLGTDAVPMGNKPAAALPQPPDDQRVSKPSSCPPPTSVPLGTSMFTKPTLRMDTSAKHIFLDAMDANEVRGCTRCPLHQSRTQTVFGEGDVDAGVMFIGEGPGENEDRTGRPFVGRAGELLDRMITAMGLSRETVYIANVVKCRPPGNRAPTPEEAQTCWDYLLRQIDTIRPRALVMLGGQAARQVLHTSEGITRIRGVWQRFELTPSGLVIPVMPTYHPAYLLRSYTPENRRKVWSDLQKVMTLIKQDG